MRPPAILNQAACKGADTEIFFPYYWQPEAYAPARRYCQRCPVWQECLQYALAEGIDHGMWGGSTPEDRRAMRAGTINAATFGPGHADKQGTRAGYERERRAGLPPCLECAAAVTKRVNERRLAREAAV